MKILCYFPFFSTTVIASVHLFTLSIGDVAKEGIKHYVWQGVSPQCASNAFPFGVIPDGVIEKSDTVAILQKAELQQFSCKCKYREKNFAGLFLATYK